MDRQENNLILQRVYQIRHVLLTTSLLILVLTNSYSDALWLKFGIDSVHWPSINGFVQQKQSLQNNTIQSRVPFYYKVSYHYIVGGKVYYGGTLGAFQFNKFPSTDGTQVTVFYDPKNPQRSCLIRGANIFWLTLELVKLSGLWLVFLCLNFQFCSAKVEWFARSIFDLPKRRLTKQLNEVSFHTRSKK